MATNISSLYIKASIQKIWDVLTKPEFIKQWQYGSDVITDWEVGNSIRFITEWKGKVYEQWGEVIEVIPYQLLKYSLFAPRPDLEDKPENYFFMSYVLDVNEGLVNLKIIQEDNRPGAVQEESQGEENPVLAALKALCQS